MTASKPVHFALLVFPGFQPLDAFGPLDALSFLSLSHPLKLSVISKTLDPVSSGLPQNHPMNKFGSFGASVLPTHTFASPPEGVDVILIPGGLGVHDYEATQDLVDYLSTVFSTIQYLITVCTGSWLAARAGVLKGLKATGNKWEWDVFTATTEGQGVEWVRKARWVEDGKVWTTSGISAGIDGTLAWMAKVYGKETADSAANIMEYTRVEDPTNDPFAAIHARAGTMP